MRADRRIAWTRRPNPETMALAEHYRVRLVVVPALRKMPLMDAEGIRSGVAGAQTLVITSGTTIDMLEHNRCWDVLQHRTTLVVGTRTARRIHAHGGSVAGIAQSSADLWNHYGRFLDATALHLSGADVASELPVSRLAVYFTMPMYPLVPSVEATALFSPRGAESVLTAKNLDRLGGLLSIGSTTTQAVNRLGCSVYLTADTPSEFELLRSYLKATS